MKLFKRKKLSKLGTYLRFISDTFDPEISWNEARMSSEIVLNDGVWMEREREKGREKQRKTPRKNIIENVLETFLCPGYTGRQWVNVSSDNAAICVKIVCRCWNNFLSVPGKQWINLHRAVLRYRTRFFIWRNDRACLMAERCIVSV